MKSALKLEIGRPSASQHREAETVVTGPSLGVAQLFADAPAGSWAELGYETVRLWVGLQRVTPERAGELLTYNVGNRAPKRSAIRRMAGAMARSEWLLSGESVIFDWHGHLANGQQRLSACAQSRVPILVLVVWGVDPAAFPVMDTGTLRSPGDVIHIAGGVKAPEAAAVVKLLRFYRAGGSLNVEGGSHPTRLQLLSDYHADRELIDWATTHGTSREVGRHPPRLLSRAEWSFLFAIFGERDRKDAFSFLHSLAHGAGLAADDPIHQLRQRLLELASTRHLKLDRTARLALCIKAWNLWRQGRRVTVLRWRPGGSAPEAFPHAE